ncbi:hypothetical protein [Limnoglobus roseus]|uniref:Uncharacterized protein n=1 Tax=Limnoglobus roseus TaxID=2598579 RepID=A0A5C1AIL5_9BACT|nr:hypothetical protein [Limnoglobus roseus]QEL19011.1 hypothetical protein PX52LOC_06062 [Limnoglobus roseus]
MEMTPKQAKRWATTRAKGRSRFIWFNGVLVWGLTMAVVWPVAMAAVQGWDRLPLLMACAIVGFPIAGYYFGV